MKKILIIAVNMDEGNLIHSFFERLGYAVRCVEAKDHAGAVAQQFDPSMVLIELKKSHPQVLGLGKLIHSYLGDSVQICAYGESQTPDFIRRLYQIGFDMFLARPLQLKEILLLLGDRRVQADSQDLTSSIIQGLTELRHHDIAHSLESELLDLMEEEEELLDQKTSFGRRMELVEKLAGKNLSFPHAVQKILQLSANDSTGAMDLSKAVASDSAMAGAVMKAANTVEVHRGARITRLEDAVVRLGFAQVKNIAMARGVLPLFEKNRRSLGLNRLDYLFHCLFTAVIASEVAAQIGVDENLAFLAGMTHEFGLLIYDQVFPGVLDRIFSGTFDEGREMTQVEQELLGFTHYETAAWLFESWQLPRSVVESVRLLELYQDPPMGVRPEEKNLLGVLGLARTLAVAGNLGNPGSKVFAPVMEDTALRCGFQEGVSLGFLQKCHEKLNQLVSFLGLEPRSTLDLEQIWGQNISPKVGFINYSGEKTIPFILFLRFNGFSVYEFESLDDFLEQSDLKLRGMVLWDSAGSGAPELIRDLNILNHRKYSWMVFSDSTQIPQIQEANGYVLPRKIDLRQASEQGLSLLERRLIEKDWSDD